MSAPERITVGIGTRNRPAALLRCLRSLRALGPLVHDVIVVDDGSEEPVEPRVRALAGDEGINGVTFIRFDTPRGLCAARNTFIEQAATPWVLNLDDDAAIVSVDSIRRGLDVLKRDQRVFAVAFVQADASGAPYPPHAQPAPVRVPSLIASFIGYGHLLRRDAMLALGGFREQLVVMGEERELCLRALDRGWRVAYLPPACVAHLPDPTGRDTRQYLHLVVRNGVLSSLYDDPFLVLCVQAPLRLVGYFRLRRALGIADPGGFRRVLRALWHDGPAALRIRRPVRWSTFRHWRKLVRQPEPYAEPAS
ncbi:MAG TPA: glycosyltransferase [Gemmatimonadaceae bacterium]|nr:glycosyltransferase [Gemmatimonadaceae bacterium]